MSAKEDSAVTNFRNYIKIKTVQPNPDYARCMEYLRGQAEELEAEFQVVECMPSKPTAIMTLLGEEPSLQSLLLNSHTDVVPVFPEHWNYDPFSAYKDDNGDIYGRGTQDMKCVGIQYLEALKRLKKQGLKFLRTVHLSFVPDEELGGLNGMGRLVEMEVFKKMNIGVALDEGYANSTEKMTVFYGQRNPWRLLIKCSGGTGHGSQFLPDTAGEKIRCMINYLLSYRDAQEQRLKDNPELKLGDVTTINLTLLEGGVQMNVVPSKLTAGFDVRIPPSEVEKFEKLLQDWCKDAGEGVSYEYQKQIIAKETTCVEDGMNPWWDAFSAACKKENIKLEKEIFPASTDMKYIRKLGISAFGFSPMNHTPRLLHDHNEFLNEKIFLRGIEIYTSIILKLANVEPY